MSLPKEPRQKMINIMYIVLTALLALNVSSEILNAFKTIEQSLNSASNIIERKNADIYKSLKTKLNDPKSAEKAAIWAPKAEKAHAFADAMYTYVESLKKELKVESGLKTKVSQTKRLPIFPTPSTSYLYLILQPINFSSALTYKPAIICC